MKLVMKIEQGLETPRGYGLAWYDIIRGTVVVMPLPLNVLAGMARQFYFWLLGGWYGHLGVHHEDRVEFDRAVWFDQKLNEAYMAGKYDGVMEEASLAPAGGPGGEPERWLRDDVLTSEPVGVLT